MKRILSSLLFLILFVTHSGAQTPAFPGAEGHGRYVTGGRGGKIVHVTNLNDSGTGSFRQAVSGTDKKTVVFDVGGVIALKSNVNIGANTTIMGQTAPAPGITMRYYTVNPNGNNIIMRFIRIRRGSEKDVNDGADASTARHFTGLMLDHCSFSWSIDEVASFYDNNNFTMQWCTIGESLNNAGHGKGAHGYGGIWGGKLASFHHNFILHVNNRSPRFNGARYNWTGYTGNLLYNDYQWQNAVQAENVDVRNCVIYNADGCYGGPGGGYINMVGNYYKSGPAATVSKLTQVTVGANGNAEDYPIYWGMTSRYFLDGNLIDDEAAGWEKFVYDSGTLTLDGDHYSKDPNHYYGDTVGYVTSGNTDYVRIRLDSPAPKGEVTTHDADIAFVQVLEYAGASLHRDDVDERYADEAESGTATYYGSVTNKPGRIDLVSDVNGYTEANFGTGSRPTGFDTDKDGMPDEWELANGLDPNKNDANLYTIDAARYYTNIEVYCNQLVQRIMLNENKEAIETVNDYYPAYYDEWEKLVEAVNPDAAVHDDPDPQPGGEAIATGTVTWPLNATDAIQGNVSSDLSAYLTAADMTVGSNLTIDNVRNSVMLDFKAKAKQSAAAATNALTFSVTAAENYLFQPTGVAFYTQRIGTDSGVEDVTWKNATATTIESAMAPDRNSYTKYARTLTGIEASKGTSSLVINIYQLNADKSTAVGNVVVTGNILSVTQGIDDLSVLYPDKATGRFNLSGQRVGNSYRGIVVKNGKKLFIH